MRDGIHEDEDRVFNTLKMARCVQLQMLQMYS